MYSSCPDPDRIEYARGLARIFINYIEKLHVCRAGGGLEAGVPKWNN